MTVQIDMSRYIEAVNDARPIAVNGRVMRTVGLVIEGNGPELK